MCFNIGVIIGPILGGLLADPARSYPSIFGGITWLLKYPYAPPNLVSAFFLLSAAAAVFFGLEEVCITQLYKGTKLTRTDITNITAQRGLWIEMQPQNR